MCQRCISVGLMVGLALVSTNTFAGQRAVEEVNFNVGLDERHFTMSDYDSKADMYNITAGVNMPVSDHAGISLSGGIGKHRSSASAEDNSLRYSQNFTGLDAAFFVRDPEIGRAGVGFQVTRWGAGSSNVDGFGPVSYTVRCPHAVAEYYFDQVTVGAARQRCEVSAWDEVSNDSQIFAGWYVMPNLNLGVAAYGMDSKKTYGIGAEFQPEFGNQALGIRLAYENSRDPNYRAFLIGFRYYFDKRVDLKTRDRRYRAEQWMLQ
jgi:hypothetical protein